MAGRFHPQSAAGWAECVDAGPGLVRRHGAQFSDSEGPSTTLIGHSLVALSGLLTRLLSTQTNDTKRVGKANKPLPDFFSKRKPNRREEISENTRCVLRASSPHVGFSPTPSLPRKTLTLKRNNLRFF